MFSVYVIVFECLMIIFFGAFVRLDTNSLSSIDFFSGSLIFLLGMLVFNTGFAMISAAYKMLSWSSIGNLLVVLAINFQWNMLWFQFWKSCFNGFSTTFSLTSSLLINCISCSLCCLLSFTDFLGKFSWRQVMIISLIESIGFSLNSAIITYGIKAFDGGGGIHIFFLSAVFSFSMWFIGFKVKEQPMSRPIFTYPGLTMGIIGLLLVLYGWPTFNSGGSLISQTLSTNSNAQSIMYQCAFSNTILTLSASVISAFLYHTPTQKVKVDHFIFAVINGGIIMASSTDVLINPVGGLVLGCAASAGTVTILKYFQTNYFFQILPSSSFRFIFGFLSGIFAAIFVAARNNVSPQLANSLLIKGAYDLAAIAVTLGFGVLFGVAAGFIIRYVPGPSKDDINNDRLLWQVTEQNLPLSLNDQLNSNRLQNGFLNQSDSRSPSFLNPNISTIQNHHQLNNPNHQRPIDYVPPPKTSTSSFSKPTLSNIKKTSTNPLRKIQSIGFDIKKPGSPMQIQNNIIHEQDQHRIQYANSSRRQSPPNIIKRLDYDSGKVDNEDKSNQPN